MVHLERWFAMNTINFFGLELRGHCDDCDTENVTFTLEHETLTKSCTEVLLTLECNDCKKMEFHRHDL
jgi:hypothetical protein